MRTISIASRYLEARRQLRAAPWQRSKLIGTKSEHSIPLPRLCGDEIKNAFSCFFCHVAVRKMSSKTDLYQKMWMAVSWLSQGIPTWCGRPRCFEGLRAAVPLHAWETMLAACRLTRNRAWHRQAWHNLHQPTKFRAWPYCTQIVLGCIRNSELAQPWAARCEDQNPAVAPNCSRPAAESHIGEQKHRPGAWSTHQRNKSSWIFAHCPRGRRENQENQQVQRIVTKNLSCTAQLRLNNEARNDSTKLDMLWAP